MDTKNERMACQLKVGEHLILPHSSGEDIGIIKKVQPDKFGQYYDITFDNFTTGEENVTFRYDSDAKVFTKEEFIKESPYELIDPPEEDVDSFRKLLSKFGLNIENEGRTFFGNRHFQVKANKQLDCKNEADAHEKLVQFVRPFQEDFHKWEDAHSISATYNFGITEDGEITAGLDMREKMRIKIPENVKNMSLHDKLKESAERVAAQENNIIPESEPER